MATKFADEFRAGLDALKRYRGEDPGVTVHTQTFVGVKQNLGDPTEGRSPAPATRRRRQRSSENSPKFRQLRPESAADLASEGSVGKFKIKALPLKPRWNLDSRIKSRFHKAAIRDLLLPTRKWNLKIVVIYSRCLAAPAAEPGRVRGLLVARRRSVESDAAECMAVRRGPARRAAIKMRKRMDGTPARPWRNADGCGRSFASRAN